MRVKPYTIYTYQSKNSERKHIIFELDHSFIHPEFYKAKDKCNSRYLKSGMFPKYIFDKSFCRPASEAESKEYIKLKKENLK